MHNRKLHYKLAPGASCDYAIMSQLTQNNLAKTVNQQRIFNTNEIVGLQFANSAVIREVDLNEISDSNPYIFKLSPKIGNKEQDDLEE